MGARSNFNCSADFVGSDPRHAVKTVLVTGATGGLGREFCNHYAAAGWSVIATCLNPSLFFNDYPKQIVVRKLDISDSQSVFEFSKSLGWNPIDLIINTVGKAAPYETHDDWLRLVGINAFSPYTFVATMMPCLERTKGKAVFLSSNSGSIGLRGKLPHHVNGGNFAYRASKAALNALAASLAFDAKPKGVTVLCLHPGFVKTKLGGPDADIEPSESVAGMVKVVGEKSLRSTGRFFDYKGKELSW